MRTLQPITCGWVCIVHVKVEILGQREQMRAVRGKLEAWQRQDDMGTAKVSALCALLRPIALECLLHIMASTDNPGLQKNLSRYITQWRRERADIGGPCGLSMSALAL